MCGVFGATQGAFSEAPIGAVVDLPGDEDVHLGGDGDKNVRKAEPEGETIVRVEEARFPVGSATRRVVGTDSLRRNWGGEKDFDRRN